MPRSLQFVISGWAEQHEHKQALAWIALQPRPSMLIHCLSRSDADWNLWNLSFEFIVMSIAGVRFIDTNSHVLGSGINGDVWKKKRIKFWYLSASLHYVPSMRYIWSTPFAHSEPPQVLHRTPTSKHVSIWYTHEYQKENKMEKGGNFLLFYFLLMLTGHWKQREIPERIARKLNNFITFSICPWYKSNRCRPLPLRRTSTLVAHCTPE